jgi:von Willebrand factor A domain-containing protein 8
LDRGHKVHQVSDAAKAEVSEEARKAAKRIADRALADRLKEIGMSESEHEIYEEFLEPIYGHISSLRTALGDVAYRSSERDWIKRQLDGDLDDARLIEGIAGEKNVYKRRGVVESSPNSQASKRKKRLRFVVDCSGSMYRFNGYDQRLTRCLQVAALVMLCFDGLDEKFEYSIVGHSGDSKCIDLVHFGRPPVNSKERLQILQTMVAHTQFCQSGDNTLGAIRQAISDVSKHVSEVDDFEGTDFTSSVVIAISDANLERYGIRPQDLKRAMQPQNSSTKTFCIFIASFGDEAEAIQRELPQGRAFVCRGSSDLPAIVRNILTVEIT